MKHLRAAFENGQWVVLENCHLGLEFVAELEEILNGGEGNDGEQQIHPDF